MLASLVATTALPERLGDGWTGWRWPYGAPATALTPFSTAPLDHPTSLYGHVRVTATPHAGHSHDSSHASQVNEPVSERTDSKEHIRDASVTHATVQPANVSALLHQSPAPPPASAPALVPVDIPKPLKEIDEGLVYDAGFRVPAHYNKQVMPNPGKVCDVKLLLVPIRVADINEGTTSFTLDAHLITSWHDPRLKWTPPSPYAKDGAMFPLVHAAERLWVPDMIFPTRAGTRERDAEVDVADVFNNGTIVRRQTINIRLGTSFNLHFFPFDKHVFRMPIEPFGYSEEMVRVVDAGSNLERMRTNPSWGISFRRTLIEHYEYEHKPGRPYSRFVLEFEASRHPESYVFGLCVPIMAVVMIAYSNFHLKEFSTRMNLLVTMVLTLIALQIVVAQVTPQTNYCTWLHYFLLGNLFAVSVILVVVVAINDFPERLQEIEEAMQKAAQEEKKDLLESLREKSKAALNAGEEEMTREGEGQKAGKKAIMKMTLGDILDKDDLKELEEWEGRMSQEEKNGLKKEHPLGLTPSQQVGLDRLLKFVIPLLVLLFWLVMYFVAEILAHDATIEYQHDPAIGITSDVPRMGNASFH